jgi:large subunit ribosomal protein L28e
MVNRSDSLVWACITKNNSFMRVLGGPGKRQGKVIFSAEAGNVKSMHSFKYSGLANGNTVDVVATPNTENDRGSNITLLKSTSSKKSKPAKSTQSTPLNKCFRRSVSTIAKQSARADLVADVNAKYTVIANAKKVEKGLRKVSKSSAGRD